MSEADAPSKDMGPEVGALLSTRRWLFVIGVAVSGGMSLLIGLTVFPRLTTAEHVLMVVSAILITVGLLMSSRVAALWIAVAGLITIMLGTVLVADGPLRWIPLNLLVSYATYYVAMLSSRRVGFIACLSGATVLALIWSRRPTNAIVANLSLLNGWIAVLQVLCGSLFLWWTWNRLKTEAQVADLQLREAQERTTAAIRAQERARLWRSTAVHLHESILNTIRYVLTTPTVDRARLAIEVDRERGSGLPAAPRPSTSIASVVDVLEEDSAGLGVVHVTGWVPDIPLDPDVFEAVRAAAVELVRNAVRHGGARTVDVTARLDVSGRVVLLLRDDGVWTEAIGDPSVGRATTLGAALADVGAEWSREPLESDGTLSRISVPRPGETVAHRLGRQGYPPFDKGRLVVTSALAGVIGAGSLYYVHMVIVGAVAERLAGLLGLVGAATAIGLVVKRRRIHKSLGLALILAPAMVPWFLLGGDYTCRQAAPLSPVLNIAGYSVMVIAAWSGPFPGAVGLSIWAFSGVLLVTSLPVSCRDSVAVALVNSLIALPVILSVAYAGARAYQRAQDAAQRTRQREIVERSTADAAADINNQLDASVREAELLLAQVVDGAEVSGQIRDGLMVLDGRIRAGIQVDPQSDGSMAVLAKSLVDMATDQGCSVSVRAITCSHSTYPIPLEVQRLLYRLLVAPASPPPRLHVFTDGEEDHLSIVVSKAALRSAGVRPGLERVIDGMTVEIEDADDDGDGVFAVLVSHACVEAEVASSG